MAQRRAASSGAWVAGVPGSQRRRRGQAGAGQRGSHTGEGSASGCWGVSGLGASLPGAPACSAPGVRRKVLQGNGAAATGGGTIDLVQGHEIAYEPPLVRTLLARVLHVECQTHNPPRTEDLAAAARLMTGRLATHAHGLTVSAWREEGVEEADKLRGPHAHWLSLRAHRVVVSPLSQQLRYT